MSLRDRVVEVRRVRAAELEPDPKNGRLHPKRQQLALRGLLEEEGFAGAALARQHVDGKLILIDGHLRREMLRDEEIPVLVTDLSEEEADKLLASFDPVGALATRDDAKLPELLAEISTTGARLARCLRGLGRNPSPAWDGAIPVPREAIAVAIC